MVLMREVILSAAAGWYPDPNGTPAKRYWDGEQWTNQTQPLITPTNSNASEFSAPAKSKRKFGCLGSIALAVVALVLFSCVTNSDDGTASSDQQPTTQIQEKPLTDTEYRNLVTWVNKNNATSYFNELAERSYLIATAAVDSDIDGLADGLDEVSLIGSQMKTIEPSPNLKFNEYWTNLYTDLISLGDYSAGVRNLDAQAVGEVSTIMKRVTTSITQLNDYLSNNQSL